MSSRTCSLAWVADWIRIRILARVFPSRSCPRRHTMAWQLLVHNNEDVIEQVRIALKTNPRTARDRTLAARNLAEARNLLDDWDPTHCSLIVLGSSTPADQRS